jgi:hypothetical protein
MNIWAAASTFMLRVLQFSIPPGIGLAVFAYSTENFMRFGGWILLGMFLPALIWISVSIKRARNDTRLNALIDTYGLQNDRYVQLYNDLKGNIFNTNHYFPIAVISLLCLFFATLLIFSNDLVRYEVPHIFTSGHTYTYKLLDEKIPSIFSQHDINTLIVISYAYLGWYAWSVSTIFSRLVTMEFVPGTVYAIMSRLVLCVIVSAVVYQISNLLPEGWPVTGDANLAAIGFTTGLFPTTVLEFVKQKFKKAIQSTAESEEMRIDVIQGISPWRMFRLYDAGLDDCENLAAANPIELWDVTNLSLLEIIDWVGQAQLAVLLQQERFIKVRNSGVRTSIDFYRIGNEPNNQSVIAELTGYSQQHIEALLARMADDPNFGRLSRLRTQIMASDRTATQPQLQVVA